MLECMCVRKLRGRNEVIEGYDIAYGNSTRTMTANELKAMIKNNKIRVLNLTLTKDGRLIDKKVEVNKSKGSDTSFVNMAVIDEFIQDSEVSAVIYKKGEDAMDRAIKLLQGVKLEGLTKKDVIKILSERL